MLRTLKARLYPTREQTRVLTEYIDQSRFIYNLALEQRILLWKQQGRSTSRYQQQVELAQCRAEDERLAAVPSNVTREALRRVDLAYQHFFRRVRKRNGAAGHPRFKAAPQYNSFAIGECGNVVRDGRIRVSGLTRTIRQRGLRPVVGTIKRLTVVRRGAKWFARILVDDGLAAPDKRPIKKAVGIDMGLTSFVSTSDGLKIEAPRYFRQLERNLARAQRRLSRCRRGSNRRRKAVVRVQNVHGRIADARDDFTHKLSKQLVSHYDLIVAEKLNVAGMARSRLAKSILDAGWSGFLYRCAYKAERAGGTFAQVNPAHTSQECSQCGERVAKELSERVHRCPCGCVLDRDVNAAKVILSRFSTPTGGRPGVARGGRGCAPVEARSP